MASPTPNCSYAAGLVVPESLADMQVLKGIHGGIREVALKMLQDVEDPQEELERFTQVSTCGMSASIGIAIRVQESATFIGSCPPLPEWCTWGCASPESMPQRPCVGVSAWVLDFVGTEHICSLDCKLCTMWCDLSCIAACTGAGAAQDAEL